MSGTPGLNPRSGMISLDLPEGTVKPVPGGVDDHHVTVVYLGPDVDDAAFARACQRARDAAAGMDGPLRGSVAGVSSFPPSASEHKDWVPHVTLAYVGEKDPLPPAVPRTPVTFTHLSVHRGKDVKRFPLGAKGAALANAGRAIGLSAQTPAYSSTPAPLGRPGGPGLWRNKSRKLPDYIENVARGIMQGGEADKSRAIATAIAAVKRWAAGGGKVSPEVRAAAAKALAEWTALKASAHAHANESGGAVALTWNGQAVDLASVDLGGYLPPHVPAGSPTGGQFGTTSGSATASTAATGKVAVPAKAPAKGGKNAANQARKDALHAKAAKLRAQAHAIDQQVAGINAIIAAQVKAAIAARKRPAPTAAAKAKAALAKARPKKPGTAATTSVKRKRHPTIAQNRATAKTLTGRANSLRAQAGALDAQANAIKLAGDSGRFLDLAVTDALAVPGPEARRLVAAAERVPPGVPEGGQFTPRPPQFTRHDTPEQAAAVINAMGPRQRAAVRASILVPPGFSWGASDRLVAAELAQRLAAGAEVPGLARGPAVRQPRIIEVHAGRSPAAVAGDREEPHRVRPHVRRGVPQLTGALPEVRVIVDDLRGHDAVAGFPADDEALSFPHGYTSTRSVTRSVRTERPGSRSAVSVSAPGVNTVPDGGSAIHWVRPSGLSSGSRTIAHSVTRPSAWRMRTPRGSTGSRWRRFRSRIATR